MNAYRGRTAGLRQPRLDEVLRGERLVRILERSKGRVAPEGIMAEGRSLWREEAKEMLARGKTRDGVLHLISMFEQAGRSEGESRGLAMLELMDMLGPREAVMAWSVAFKGRRKSGRPGGPANALNTLRSVMDDRDAVDFIAIAYHAVGGRAFAFSVAIEAMGLEKLIGLYGINEVVEQAGTSRNTNARWRLGHLIEEEMPSLLASRPGLLDKISADGLELLRYMFARTEWRRKELPKRCFGEALEVSGKLETAFTITSLLFDVETALEVVRPYAIRRTMGAENAEVLVQELLQKLDVLASSDIARIHARAAPTPAGIVI